MIGFTGASRTGKSTLARLAAANLGFTYHEMRTAEIMAGGGFENIGNLPIDVRIAAQEFYLKRYAEIIDGLPRPVLVDRTPLDLIGYMMAEVGMHATTPEQGERIRVFCERALSLANRNFGIIFIPVPLPTYQVADGKAPANPAYQWHTHWIMEGAAQMMRGPTMVRISALDLETRVNGVCEVILEWLNEISLKRSGSPLH
uniref:AAA family ATPase n=1 Tax=Methylobacterium sp. B34 TaxID=95563 RepID=UPI00034A0279|nr:AAA family ATPase [Methylobacterium sp. B34]